MPAREYYRISEVAEMLGISRQAAYKYAEQGIIPTCRIGGVILVPITPLKKMLARQTDNSNGGPDGRR